VHPAENPPLFFKCLSWVIESFAAYGEAINTGVAVWTDEPEQTRPSERPSPHSRAERDHR
jgi:hypothetical protein